jgi:hypothetical protein
VSLRERKQKNKKITKEAADEFSMIVLDPKMKVYEQNCSQEQMINDGIPRKSEKNDEKAQRNYE